MKTMYIDIDTVSMIRVILPSIDDVVNIYIGKFKVQKILNTNMYKITVLEDSQIGASNKRILPANEVLYIAENYLVEMRR